MAALQNVQLGPKKLVAHWLQPGPAKPVWQAQAPVAVQEPWPLHVVAALQEVQLGKLKKLAAHWLQVSPAKPLSQKQAPLTQEPWTLQSVCDVQTAAAVSGARTPPTTMRTTTRPIHPKIRGYPLIGAPRLAMCLLGGDTRQSGRVLSMRLDVPRQPPVPAEDLHEVENDRHVHDQGDDAREGHVAAE